MMSIIDNKKYIIQVDENKNFNTYAVKENDYDNRINYFIDFCTCNDSHSVNSNNYSSNPRVSTDNILRDASLSQ